MTGSPPSPFDVPGIQRWLMDARHRDDGGSSFILDLKERLLLAGLPLWRISYALITMHPEVLWRTVQWQEGQEVVVRDQTHTRLDDHFYKKSPVALAREGGEPVRVLLDGTGRPFPICEDLRAKGATDYYAHSLAFSNGQVGYISYATRFSGGFEPQMLEALEAIRPFLARRIELESSYYATRALLDVYLGKNAARRVFEGAFQRGKGELIDAVIWFSDMRDFTALSDRSSADHVIETLDSYFDAVASAISRGGGEVLKFIGDAVMAIFPLEGDARGACRRAMIAADEAFASLAEVNRGRLARGESNVAIGVALHRGEVMYGNIGARDRLDFTVISSAVNEASRLESLCKQLGTPLALSERFALTAEVEDLVDLGVHQLKGVRVPLRVFTPRRLAPDR